jgi:phosphoribosyl 1,2-cyclic phosphodiesterase
MLAQLQFVELEGPPLEIAEVKVSYVYLNHPGLAIGFRVDWHGKSVVYVTDHEPYARLSGDNELNRKLDREVDSFANASDLYIREAQYTEDEYAAKKGWGHSTWKDAVDSAQVAGVRRLSLYHHDPMHDDEDIDRMVASCHRYMKEQGMNFECTGAAEGQEFAL